VILNNINPAPGVINANYLNNNNHSTNNYKMNNTKAAPKLSPSQEALVTALNEGKRNKDLEKIILEDAQCCVDYARYIIKGRWPEAEDVIVNAPINTKVLGEKGWGRTKTLIYVYTNLIKDRFPKAEEKMTIDKGWWGHSYAYTKLIIRLKGEIVDFNKPGIVVWLMDDINKGKIGKRIKTEKKWEILDQLYKRITLFAFSHPGDRNIKKYVNEQKKFKQSMMLELRRQDKNMTVEQLIEKLK
jgi:hypothetical protein